MDEKGEKSRELREKPLTISFRKCHILKPENSSASQDSNSHWWRALAWKVNVQTIASFIAPTVIVCNKFMQRFWGYREVSVGKSMQLHC